ncbi:GTPase HflX [bacterium]|nr:GTPase HflX [bacterium]
MTKKPVDPKKPPEKCVLLSALLPDDPRRKLEKPLDELHALADTARVNVVGEVVQKREKPDPATYVGKGTVARLKQVVTESGADTVISDNDLSPGQSRNLEKALEKKVIDRTELILDIFAQNARTPQAKLQVELAQLEYSLPRLRRMWSHLGGVGFRGPGEKQLETDKRLIRDQIHALKRELKEIRARKEREVATRDAFSVAIVGYTNAGKSTLMNALTGAGVYVADQLFATLDTRTRPWKVAPRRHVLVSDTVGFISNLPHRLVESFHATLEEVLTADLLLHVVDASNPDPLLQAEAVRTVLEQIGATGKPELTVLNKIDRIEDRALLAFLERRLPRTIPISARTGEGIERLASEVATLAIRHEGLYEVQIDVREGAAIAALEALAEPSERSIEKETLRLVLRTRKRSVEQAAARARDRKRVRLRELEPPAIETEAALAKAELVASPGEKPEAAP